MKRPNNPSNPVPIWQQPGFPIWLILFAFLLVGLVLVTHYGESWDEPFRYAYAQKMLAAYFGGPTNIPDEKGPFYGMVALLGSNLFSNLIPGWKGIDGWHFMTYLSFLMGLYFFYRLCRRFVEITPAAMATLLFATQPVIWGHAFINPKDIPYMAFFLASVVLGLDMVDHFSPAVPTTAPAVLPLVRIQEDWQTAPPKSKRRFMILGITWIGLPIVFPLAQIIIAYGVAQVYFASPSGWIGKLFARVAQAASRIPVQAYIHKAQTLSSWLALLIWIGLGLAVVLVAWRVFPSLSAWLLDFHLPTRVTFASWTKMARNPLTGTSTGPEPSTKSAAGSTVAAFLKEWLHPKLLIAACFLGFCSDIRTLGPAAGLMVTIYFFSKAGLKAIPRLIAYFGIGAAIAYLFWPYLWSAPVSHYLHQFSKVQNYDWSGVVLFSGQLIQNGDLPSSYLPVLLSLQFTEIAMALCAAGLFAAGVTFLKKESLRIEVLLIGAWFILPVLAAIVLHSSLYDNFRQFLFVIPPIFVLAGLALQGVWTLLTRIKRRLLFAGLAIAILIPGITADILLHPYEYVYYNGLAGGVTGAYRNYDIDYWATSYRKDLEYLNKIAPKNAAVVVFGADRIATTYARSDLTILAYPLPADYQGRIDYAIEVTAGNEDQLLYPKSKVIYQVMRDGAVLSVVKQIMPDDPIGE